MNLDRISFLHAYIAWVIVVLFNEPLLYNISYIQTVDIIIMYHNDPKMKGQIVIFHVCFRVADSIPCKKKT